MEKQQSAKLFFTSSNLVLVSQNSIVTQWQRARLSLEKLRVRIPSILQHLGIEQLVVYLFWIQEDVGSSPASQTKVKCSVRLMVRTPAFRAANKSSILLRSTIYRDGGIGIRGCLRNSFLRVRISLSVQAILERSATSLWCNGQHIGLRSQKYGFKSYQTYKN